MQLPHCANEERQLQQRASVMPLLTQSQRARLSEGVSQHARELAKQREAARNATLGHIKGEDGRLDAARRVRCLRCFDRSSWRCDGKRSSFAGVFIFVFVLVFIFVIIFVFVFIFIS